MKPGQASNTALVVAAGMQLVRPRAAYAHLMPREALRRGASLLKSARPALAWLLRHRLFASVLRALERATLPGILLHYALRKQRLRQHARDAIANGCTQVVVLGAGLDTLSMELKASYPHLCCVEIDHPATQAIKRRAVGAEGQSVHFVSADLQVQTLASALGECSVFQPAAPTLYVAEGLLMYIPVEGVAGLFAQMAKLTRDCQVAFTWFEPQADGRPNFNTRSRVVDIWLRLRSEPFLSAHARARLPDFLAAYGFVVNDVVETIELLEPHVCEQLQVKDLPISGEYVCLARAAPEL